MEDSGPNGRTGDSAVSTEVPGRRRRWQVGTVLQMRRQIRVYAQKPALERVVASL